LPCEYGHPLSLVWPWLWWCPVCNGWRGYGWTWFAPSNLWYRHLFKGKIKVPIKKPILAVQGMTDLTGLPDKEFARDFPSLAEALFMKYGPDGKRRETHTLLLCEGDGAWKGMLRDNEEGAQLWHTASTLTDLFLSLNAAIETGLGDWRPFWTGKKAKGKGK
jgi:hypothetical protein